MARKFLTPVSLPSGTSNPSAGVTGALFYRSDLEEIYVYTGSYWTPASSSVSNLDSLTDVATSSVADGDIVYYDSTEVSWVNRNLQQILQDYGLLSADGGGVVTSIIDGGTPTTVNFTGTYDGGNESSF